MKQIAIDPDQQELQVDFTLSQGLSIPLKVVDELGRPLGGVQTQQLRSERELNYRTTSSEVRASGFTPARKRHIVFHHQELGLSQIIELDSSDFGKDNESAAPKVVRLQPNARVKGKLVNSEGDPVANALVRASLSGSRDFNLDLQVTAINQQGEFKFSAFPGANCSIQAETEKVNNVYMVYRDLAIDPGELIDLGTIDISTKDRAEPKRTKLGSVGLDENKSFTKNDADPEMISVSGNVIDANKKPVAGADVVVRLRYRPTQMPEPLCRTTSDAAGNFRIEYPAAAVVPFLGLQKDDFNTTIEVTREGFVRNWIDIAYIKDSHATVELSTESEDVVLSLVDLEGNPILGTATAEIRRITRFGKPIAEILAAADGSGHPHESAMLPDGSFYTSMKYESDENGRIRFPGLAPNCLYVGQINGTDIANHFFEFATSIKNDFGYDSGDEMTHEYEVVFANRSMVPCEPGQRVTGVVRDGDTGKPIEGAELIGTSSPANSYFRLEIFSGQSDGEGRFSIPGLGIGERNAFFAINQSDKPYVSRHIRLPTVNHAGPLQHDFEMYRGGRIRLLVVDSATGEPMPSAYLQYSPLYSNPANENYPEHKFIGLFGSCPGEVVMTDSEGKCELVGFPGQGIVSITIRDSKIRTFQGGAEITKVVGPEKFPPADGKFGDFIVARNPISPRLTAVRLVEIKDVDVVTEMRIEIDMTPVTEKGNAR